MDGAPVFQMRFNPTGDQLAAALDCEASVFLKAYGNTPEQLAEEYGPYAAASVFIGIYEPGGDAVGAVRLIRPTGLGLKTLHDVSRPPWSLDVPRMARAAVSGAVLATLQIALTNPELVDDSACDQLVEQLLRMLGLPLDAARELAHAPLPVVELPESR